MQTETYLPYLSRIREQEREMIQLTFDWSAINSGSYHTEGLARMIEALDERFHWLGGQSERLDLPPMASVNARGEIEEIALGQALRIRKRPEAKLQIFLGGHMDTVFGRDHPFQMPRYLNADGNPLGNEWGENMRLNGPGAADLKGGLVVMLKALEVLEASPWAERVGWEILINPDEEIGSIGSAPLLAEAAKRCHLGLVYEPSLPDGTLVSSRKGSGNFTLVARGRAAHAGREHHLGRNAIAGLAAATLAIGALNGQREGVTINPGKIEGGGAVNVVPDLAILRFNVRMPSRDDQAWLAMELARIVETLNQGKNPCLEAIGDGALISDISYELHGGFTRPPKEISEGIRRLQAAIECCGAAIGTAISWQATGGCCDGNNLAAHGLPNIDTLGVRGAHIHCDREYALLDSLAERAKLSALLLMGFASGEIVWPHA